MREIKYRAWDKDRKEMVKVHSIHLNAQKVILTGICFGGNRSVPFDEIELMEYTGLKDANGKEIYEGDILYHKLQGKRVVYYPFNEHVASYGLREISSGFCSTLQDSHRVYELIGNIHENPELLKGE